MRGNLNKVISQKKNMKVSLLRLTADLSNNTVQRKLTKLSTKVRILRS